MQKRFRLLHNLFEQGAESDCNGSEQHISNKTHRCLKASSDRHRHGSSEYDWQVILDEDSDNLSSAHQVYHFAPLHVGVVRLIDVLAKEVVHTRAQDHASKDAAQHPISFATLSPQQKEGCAPRMSTSWIVPCPQVAPFSKRELRAPNQIRPNIHTDTNIHMNSD